MSDREAKKLVSRLTHVFEPIYSLTNRAGYAVYTDFQKLPPRTGTEYYKFISRPISLHTIGRNVKRHAYKDAQTFIDDLAQITWNARHFNEPGLDIYENALVMEKYVREVAVPKLASDPKVPNAQLLVYPDLGPLEDYGHMSRYEEDGNSASPYVKNEDFDDDDLMLVPRRSHFGSRNSGAVRRGRPPIIDKPYESRIKAIIKLFKRVRHPDDENHILTHHFERLPDKSHDDYYQTVANPISLHEIRTKVRSRKYTTVQQFLDDLSLMISNAKLYYSSDPGMSSDIHLFEQQADAIIQVEMQRPDSDYILATSSGADRHKTPLDSVTVNNHRYSVGDWVLIRNPNDAQKPICGQIFRLWNADGVDYTNVCWYIRPEQTCHRADRLFYMNEVCKTGEYSDHTAADIVAPCYVIFVTHYQKGDIPPNLLPPGAEWFICEFRYNANTFAFNRIRTWKACLPDEIRHVDQPIVPINEPRKLIKYDSPLKGLLTYDSPDDALKVAPVEGPNENGPPLMGAVFQKPPYTNDELGQCSTSPNVTPLPEYDDLETGRKAYIFTPVSQLKTSVTGSGVYSSSGTRHVNANYIPGVAETPGYDSPQDGLQQDSAYGYSALSKQKNELLAGARENSPSHHVLTGSFNTTSIYSNVLPGGVVSYFDSDTAAGAKAKEISVLLINSNGRMVWFRSPPSVINQQVITPVSHSAKYLAWKIKQSGGA